MRRRRMTFVARLWAVIENFGSTVDPLGCPESCAAVTIALSRAVR
ncbi:hypothetical protein [Mycolicibacterium phlei]